MESVVFSLWPPFSSSYSRKIGDEAALSAIERERKEREKKQLCPKDKKKKKRRKAALSATTTQKIPDYGGSAPGTRCPSRVFTFLLAMKEKERLNE